MGVCEEPARKSANAFMEEELLSSQHLNNRGCTNSPFWKKTVVYDCVEQTVKVLNEKDIDKHLCLRFDLPKHKQVTIFVDAKTESKPTIASKGPGGERNVELATIHLDRLGIIPNLFRRFGQLSTLYVMKTTPWSGTSSQVISDGMSEVKGERDETLSSQALPHS